MHSRRATTIAALSILLFASCLAGCGQGKEEPSAAKLTVAASPESEAAPARGAEEPAGARAEEKEEPAPPPVEVSPEVKARCAVFEPPWGEQWWVTWGQENPEEGEEWMDTVEETMAKADLSVLSQCKHLDRLFAGFTDIEDLTPISKLERLKYLDLRFCPKLKDLAPLAKLRNLEHLVISGSGVVDLSPLSKVKSIKELEARQLLVRDASPIAEMPNLWRVDLLQDPISDVSPLARAPKVRKVRLCQTDIEGYEGLLPAAKRITELETCNSKIRPESFGQIAKFENLTFLRLWGNPIEDLSPLAGLSELEELDLTQTKVKDLTPLHGLKKLKKVYLMMVDIEESQIEALKKAVPGVDVQRKMEFN